MALAVNAYLPLPTGAAPPGALAFARARLAEHAIPVRVSDPDVPADVTGG